MNKRYYLGLTLILVPLLILTACGGGGTTTTTPPGTPTTTLPTTSPPATTPTQTETTTPPPSTSETSEPTPTETPEPTPVVFTITSTAFENGGVIPSKHGFFTGNKSPQLAWSGAPEGTESFVLIMEDPDGGMWSHWVVYNIPSDVFELEEGLSYEATLANGAMQGINDIPAIGYEGPSPPSGTHRYYFTLYALDTTLDLAPGATRLQVSNAMQGHILDQVEYMGTYSVQ